MTDLADARILIVDDVKANVDVLVQALRDDYKLSVALSGESALRSAEKSPPDLVLLDIMMPGLDGYEVCRRLRAGPATQDVPVMFLSSLDEAANKAQGFEVGGNDYLTKPFAVVEAKARVRSLLKAKAYSDAAKEKIASELRIAREIQTGILPADITALRTAPGSTSPPRWSRPRRSAGTCTRWSARTTGGWSWSSETCRARASRPPCSWR